MKYLVPCFIFLICLALFNPVNSFADDLSTLNNRKVPAKLLEKYDSEFAKKHPEHGILPFNAPCTDCIELLEKRTPNTREFRGEVDSKGVRQVFTQKSLCPMSYKDKNGFLVTNDPRFVKESEFVYAARHQPYPVVVDFQNKWSSISTYGKELKFNRDIALVLVGKNGEMKNFGAGDWSHLIKYENYTETVFLVKDFYQGIDLQMTASPGAIKTSFIINRKPEIDKQFEGGYLAMTQNLDLPDGLTTDLSESGVILDDKRLGKIKLVDKNNNNYFFFTKSIAFDSKNNSENYLEMPFTVEGNKVDYFVPVNWLNGNSTSYPVTIDPFVYSADSLLQSAFLGSGYTATCGTNGCSYFLNNVPTPANCVITNISTNFSYLANLPCVRPDGGFNITMTNPNGVNCVTPTMNCIQAVQGACFFWPAQLPTLMPCMLPPQCPSYNLDFEMKFWRCNWVPIAQCDSSCIRANSNWIITIEGRTVELTNVSLPQTICEGTCANLSATAAYGVPLVVGTTNYTFTWQPNNIVGDVVNVCPTTSTHYNVTVTDLCGLTDTGSTDITVVPTTNPGFTISPNDTVCTNTPMTFSGGGAGAATSYDWIISCPANASFNDTQNLNWTAPATTGSCTATLTYQVVAGALTCNFSQTQSFVVEPGSPPLANITYVPNGLCPGQAVTFTANVTSPGTGPTYQWSLNGTPVAGATNVTWNTTAPASQFTVSVFVTSNSPCANPDTVTAGIVVPVSNAAVPGVVITATPNAICPGQAVTFHTAPTNGGAAPTYQWQLNGVNINGATDSTYTGNPNPGDIFGVVMTSNSPCVNPPTASDTETVSITANLVPTVSVAADQPNVICAGTQVTFTASPTNEGPNPTYQWQLGGVNIAGATNINYTTIPAGAGGIYGVIVTSSLACANPNTANDTILMTVVPGVVPAVSITATVDTVCTGDPVVFTAHPVGGGTNPSYQWTVDGNLQGSTSDTMHFASTATSYNVSVQIISNAPCANPATATANYNIFVRPTPVPAVSVTLSDDTVCAGTPVTFTADTTNGGSAPTYQWLLNNTAIAGATNLTYNTTPVNTSDVYSFTMTSNALCVSPPTATTNASVVVLSNAAPDVVVSSDVGQIVCDNTPMTFTAAPTNGGNNPGFQWLLNGTAIAGATNVTYSPPLPVATGSIFECVLTTSLSCAVPTTDNDTLQMTILPIVPTSVGLTSTDDTICDGTPVTFTANPSGGGADPAYSWTINGNVVNGNDTSFLTSSTMTDGAIVGVTMTSTLPCSSPASTTYTIYVTPVPVPSISQVSAPPSVCAGGTLNFTATGVNPGPGPTYQWYVNGNPVAGQTNDTYSDILNNGDIVSVEMTSNAPCVNPATATSNQIVADVIAYVTPDVSIASDIVNDTICVGQNVTFTANGNNGGPSPSYNWYVNGIDQGVNSSTFTSSTLVQGDIITAMLTSSEPCLTQPTANSNQILINVYPPLNLIATGSTVICPFEPVTLNAFPGGGDGGPYNYNWSHNAGTTATVIVTPGVTTQYTVVVTDNCNSNPVSDSVLVTVNPSPDANLTYRPLEPSSLAPDVIFRDLSLNPITWEWSFGDGDSSNIQNPPHTYEQPGEYNVTLIVTNAYGCIDSITYKLIVKEDISVFIPNCFTPNGDGRNEFFTPMGTSLEDFDFWIFDRWGQEVFHGNENNPWLGLSERTGKPAPEDVYVYKVDLKYSKFGKRYVTGRVSLVY